MIGNDDQNIKRMTITRYKRVKKLSFFLDLFNKISYHQKDKSQNNLIDNKKKTGRDLLFIALFF
jgi:hypothetical protein